MDDYDSKLQELHLRFRQQLPERLASCLDAWNGFIQGIDPEALDQLRFQTHKLAGAASIYGFDNIGESARSIELLVDQIYNNKLENSQPLTEQLQQHILQLENLINAVEQ